MFARFLLPSATLACTLLAANPFLSAQITEARPMPSTVSVQVLAKPLYAIPDEIFGSFLEPIGNSINGGVSAELLTNGSLEAGLWNHANLETLFREQPELIDSTNDTGIPMPWLPLHKGLGNRFELHVGQAANSWQSLAILGTPAGEAGIRQRIYLPVQRELSYKVALYAKQLSGPAGLRLMLLSRDNGKVLAEAKVKVASSNWTLAEATLTLPPGQVQRLQPVDFAVAVEAAGSVELDQLSLLPADAVGILDPDEIAMVKAMNLTELRLGGNFSSYYHWQDGVGPRLKRPTLENIAWGIPEYNQFGTDEFLALCEAVQAVPQFDLNMGSGSPEEAVDWVRYISERHKGRVIYELGNELWGRWQVGWKTEAEIGPATLAFSRAVRAAAPKAELIATGLGPIQGEKWNEGQLRNPAGTFDLLSEHFILGTNRDVQAGASPEFMAAAAYAIPAAIGPYFDEVQKQIAAHGLNGKVHQALTEWLFNSRGQGERNFTNESPSWRNEGGAVMAAGFLNTILRHADQIGLTNMTGSMEFAGVWKKREQVYAVPAYYAFRMYSAVKGHTVLASSSDSGSYNVAGGVKPLDAAHDVPYVDVVATRSPDGRRLTLLIVNRSVDRDQPTRFDLSSLLTAGTAHGEQIRADSRLESNDEVEPNHVVPLPISAPVEHGSLRLTLPHDSVTVLQMELQ